MHKGSNFSTSSVWILAERSNQLHQFGNQGVYLFINIYSFIWLCQVLAVAYGI